MSDCTHESIGINKLKPGWICEVCGEPFVPGTRLGKLQADYNYAAEHADRGWEYLKQAVAALYAIASPGEGEEVTSSFDEPGSARMARDALNHLPSAGAYEGLPPWSIRDVERRVPTCPRCHSELPLHEQHCTRV